MPDLSGSQFGGRLHGPAAFYPNLFGKGRQSVDSVAYEDRDGGVWRTSLGEESGGTTQWRSADPQRKSAVIEIEKDWNSTPDDDDDRW